MSQLIQVRRGTAAAWTAANPTLSAGEPGFETDTGKFKIGDGATAWTSLSYTAGGTPLLVGQAPHLFVPVGEWFGKAGGSANFAFSNGVFVLQQVEVPVNMTISKMACKITTGGSAGSVLRFGIYRDADGDGKPDTLVLDAGTLASTASGPGIITLGTPQVLAAGTYWVCAVPQGAPATNPTLAFFNAPVALQSRSANAGSPPSGDASYGYTVGAGATGALPSTIAPTGGSSANPPIVDLFRSA